MNRALKKIRHNGTTYLPGAFLPSLSNKDKARLVRRGSLEVIEDPTPKSEPKTEVAKADTQSKATPVVAKAGSNNGKSSGKGKAAPKAQPKQETKPASVVPDGIDPNLAGG